MEQMTPVAIAFVLALVGLLAWRVGATGFRALSWQSTAIAAALFWGVLAALLLFAVWETYYSHFLPRWYRLAALLGAVALYPLLGLAIRWLALRLPGNPVVLFCLIGGLESVPEHLVGIYGFDILEIPVLQGSTATSILVFAYFEYVVFWALTLLLAIGVDRLHLRGGMS